MNFLDLVLEAIAVEDITIRGVFPTYPEHSVSTRGAWTAIYQVKGDPRDYNFFYFEPNPRQSFFKDPMPFDYAEPEYLDSRLLMGMVEKVKAYLLAKHHGIDYDKAITIAKI